MFIDIYLEYTKSSTFFPLLQNCEHSSLKLLLCKYRQNTCTERQCHGKTFPWNNLLSCNIENSANILLEHIYQELSTRIII